MLFLIEYDIRSGTIIKFDTYEDMQRHEAEDARLALDLSLRNSDSEREIVLLEAASEAALRKTHRRYFESLESLVRSA